MKENKRNSILALQAEIDERVLKCYRGHVAKGRGLQEKGLKMMAMMSSWAFCLLSALTASLSFPVHLKLLIVLSPHRL